MSKCGQGAVTIRRRCVPNKCPVIHVTSLRSKRKTGWEAGKRKGGLGRERSPTFLFSASNPVLRLLHRLHVIFVRRGKKTAVFILLYCNKLSKSCFVISVLNNKIIILLNLAEYPLSLARRYNIPRDFVG